MWQRGRGIGPCKLGLRIGKYSLGRRLRFGDAQVSCPQTRRQALETHRAQLKKELKSINDEIERMQEV